MIRQVQPPMHWPPINLDDPLVSDGALIGAWPCWKGSAKDYSGAGNHGVLTNMEASDWVSSPVGAALSYDGADEYMIAGSGTGLKGISRDGWTIACLAKWGAGVLESVISLGDDADLPDGAILINRNGTVQCYVSDAYRDSGVATPAGWTFLALTRVSATEGYLYVDGQQFSANPDSTSIDTMDLRIARFCGTAEYGQVQVTCAYCWARALMSPELRELSRVPWRPYCRPSNLPLLAATGGAAAYVPYPYPLHSMTGGVLE